MLAIGARFKCTEGFKVLPYSLQAVSLQGVPPRETRISRPWQNRAKSFSCRQGYGMKRRSLLTFLSSAAIGWQLPAIAQQANRVRRIGVLMGLAETDPEGQSRLAALRRSLKALGWVEGSNAQLELRWAAGDIERTNSHATDLVRWKPDVIVVNSPSALMALRKATITVPIVFVQVVNALESNFIASLARPGGNITGFTSFFDYATTAKWLQMLKEIAPGITRVALIQHPEHPSWPGHLKAVEAVAQSFRVRLTPAAVRNAAEIERTVASFASKPDGALLVLPDTFNTVHRELIIALAARYRLPAIYPSRFFPAIGGLMSYGSDLAGLLGQAASYVDRILRGARPGDLPIQASMKFELVINLKTAKALGLTVPLSLLISADNMIE